MHEQIKALQEVQSSLERKNGKTTDIDLTPEINKLQELTQEISESTQPKRVKEPVKEG